jgi:nitrate/nitrite transporter NarK
MLSLMLGFGIVSRLASGWITDHIGGLRTLLIGSSLQALALVLFVPFDGLASVPDLALFGLFQGGSCRLLPLSCANTFRRVKPCARGHGAHGHGVRHAGGWMSGAIFDLTGPTRLRSRTSPEP